MDEVSPSKDGIFICQISGENCMDYIFQLERDYHLLDMMHTVFILGCHPWMEKCHLWMEICHPLMEKCHLWMSYMDGEMSSLDGEMSCS